MYFVRCDTCSEETTVDAYGAANEFFMEHAEQHHEVELGDNRHVVAD